MKKRIKAITQWISSQLNDDFFTLKLLMAEASFRQYYRISFNKKSYILMDAPPKLEKTDHFLHIQNIFTQYGLNAPKIYAASETNGFILMEDFGNTQLYQTTHAYKHHSPHTPAYTSQHAYQAAIETLLKFQTIQTELPQRYTPELFQKEMDLFMMYFLPYLQVESHFFSTQWQYLSQIIQSCIHKQPFTFTHRDFHSRNLMVLNEKLGILDFQDAIKGPITYDLISLIKDCYVKLTPQHAQQLSKQFYDASVKANLLHVDWNTFLWWCDCMGLQRHLKCLGIFTRLYTQRGRTDYLQHIPQLIDYISEVLEKYEVFSPFHTIWLTKITGNSNLNPLQFPHSLTSTDTTFTSS